MPALLSSLNTMGRAMLSQRAGANTAGHNIANVNTPGFRRQEVLLEAMAPSPHGVKLAGNRHAVDDSLERRYNTYMGLGGYSQTRAQHAADIESTIGQLGEDSIGQRMAKMFGAFRELTAAPGDHAHRLQVIQRGQEFASSVRNAATNLASLQNEYNSLVNSDVDRANTLITEIANLNGGIKQLEAGGGQALSLRDQRDSAAQELAFNLGARIFIDDQGDMTVLAGGGLSLVQGQSARTLLADPDPGSGLTRVRVSGGAQIDIGAQLTGGTLRAHLEARDADIPQRMDDLDQLAFDVSASINAVHRVQFGLDGATGRDFFVDQATVNGAAASFSVDAVVANDPQAIGAATDPTMLPGDGRGATNLANIEDQNVAAGGTISLGAYWTSIVSDVGTWTQSLGVQASRADLQLEQVDALREQVSGVNLEEQMLSLMRYQRGFEAASRVIKTVDEMLDTLMAM